MHPDNEFPAFLPDEDDAERFEAMNAYDGLGDTQPATEQEPATPEAMGAKHGFLVEKLVKLLLSAPMDPDDWASRQWMKNREDLLQEVNTSPASVEDNKDAWTINAILELLTLKADNAMIVDLEGNTFYTYSTQRGTERRHVFTYDYNDNLTVNQIDPSERYQQVNNYPAEVVPVITAKLLKQHLDHKKQSERDALEDHPF